MKYISLFAGIGGFDLALNREGFQCVYANEWDKYANSIYERNFNHKPDSRDIRTVPVSDIPEHDLLVGGFPCQSFSIAGKRGGFNDTRGTMFFEIARILKDKRPRHLLLENVKGLLSHDDGKTFQTILGVLADLGYECQWMVLNSKDFGVPQNRERVFIVGHLRGQRRPKILPVGIDDSTLVHSETGTEPKTKPASAITTREGGRKENNFIVQLNDPTHSNNRVYSDEGLSPTLNAMQGGNRQPFVAMRWGRTEKGKQARRESRESGKDYTPWNKGHRELRPATDGIVGTITSQAVAKDSLLGIGSSIRRLTPTECSLLQGLPPDWTKYGLEEVSLAEYNQGYGNAEKRDPTKILRVLWETIKENEGKGWGTTEFITLFEKEVLQQEVHVGEFQRSLEKEPTRTTGELQSKAISGCDRMWEMWLDQELGYTPQGQKQIEQLFIQFRGSLQELSQQYSSWKPSRIVKISDTQRYKTLGNAVTVNVVQHIASCLKSQ